MSWISFRVLINTLDQVGGIGAFGPALSLLKGMPCFEVERKGYDGLDFILKSIGLCCGFSSPVQGQWEGHLLEPASWYFFALPPVYIHHKICIPFLIPFGSTLHLSSN